MKKKVARRVFTVFLGLLIGYVFFGFIVMNKPMVIEPSEEWLEFIENADFEIRDLEVESSGFSLDVEMFIPEGGNEKKPVVVFGGGSGHVNFRNYSGLFIQEVLIEYFHSYDISVVLINKRGMGESEGNWVYSDYDDRAADYGSVIDVLKEQDDVDVNHIGVMGHSQGGWIAPLVASQRDDIAFWVAYAGPATSYIEQLEDLHETYYMCDGYTEEEIAKKINQKVFISKVGAMIGKVLPFGDMGFDSRIIDYDPEDLLREIDVPGMMLFGEYDLNVDPERNYKAFDRIFDETDNNYITYHTVPDANHSFRVVDNVCESYAETAYNPYAEELFEYLDNWLQQLGYEKQ